MIALLIPSKLAHARCLGGLVLGLGLFALTAVMSSALAQSVSDASLSEPNVSARKIFIMLFLMLGPIKILVPFVNLTKNAESVLRRRLATRAMLFSLAALALAGLLGRNILENFEISVPVLALTGGLILFLVALRTVLEQSIPQARLKQESISPGTDIALSPLVFPIIVTPYGNRRCHCVCHPRAGRHVGKADRCQHRSSQSSSGLRRRQTPRRFCSKLRPI
jgi:multiple antibiotic resistance protein